MYYQYVINHVDLINLFEYFHIVRHSWRIYILLNDVLRRKWVLRHY